MCSREGSRGDNILEGAQLGQLDIRGALKIKIKKKKSKGGRSRKSVRAREEEEGGRR